MTSPIVPEGETAIPKNKAPGQPKISQENGGLVTQRLEGTRDIAAKTFRHREGELPIDARKKEVLELVERSDDCLITAATGAGKSTQVPQWLLDAGYRVVVTQPRRIAAKSLAQWIARRRHEPLGKRVGFRTAQERRDSAETDLLYCTDGLQLVRELAGKGVRGKKTVLILDEVHEWNLNIETLVAWVKKQRKEGAEFKVVLMSATLETEKLAEFLGREGKSAPFLKVEGRLYPVEERYAGASELIAEVTALVKAQRNVLIFQPGKSEIEKTITALKSSGLDAEILPLHGELDPDEQEKVFAHYLRPKIVVATNVAQTSITIDDIDAVVDSGMERRKELVDGIEGLYLKPISQADCQQRKGRAGRCKPGVYVLCARESTTDRQDFPKAEIHRTRLDQTVLRLANIGIDATALEFFHQPDRVTLKEAKRALIALGAMNEQGQVTEIGRAMAEMPINVHLARMVVEAEKYDCVADILTIAACLEADGIRDRTSNWRALTKETESDLLADLDLYRAAGTMKGDEMKTRGIFAKSFFRAKEIRRSLADSLQRVGIRFGAGKGNGDREKILRSVVAGMVDHLYQSDYGRYRRNGDTRELGRESIVTGGQWVVGVPKDIEVPGKRGRTFTLHLLTMCSKVDPTWLLEVAPQLIQKKRRNPIWSHEKQRVVEEEITIFNGQEIKSDPVDANEGEEAFGRFYTALGYGHVTSPIAHEIHAHNEKLRKDVEALYIRSGGKSKEFSPHDEIERFRKILDPYKLLTRDEFEAIVPAKINPEHLKFKIEDIVSEKAEIERNNPLETVLNGKTYAVIYGKEYWGNFSATVSLSLADAKGLLRCGKEHRLPSGRMLSFCFTDEEYKSLDHKTDLQELLNAAESRRLSIAFDVLKKNHPPIQLIRVGDHVKLPAPEVYDSITGALAYPAIVDSWGSFSLQWFQRKEDADGHQKRRDEAIARKHEEEQREARLTRIKTEGDAILATVKEALSKLKKRAAPLRDFAQEVEGLERSLPYGALKDSYNPESDINTVEAVQSKIPDLEKRIVETERRKAKEDKDVEEKVARGEILVNFSFGHDSHADVWIICQDGSHRPPDRTDVPRHKRDGTYFWDRVNEDEAALTWYCSNLKNPVGRKECKVAKKPVKGFSPAQCEAIANIEHDLGVLPGAFGTNEQLREQHVHLKAAVIHAFPEIPDLAVMLEDERNVTALQGKNGFQLNLHSCPWSINWTVPFSATCEEREAMIVLSHQIGDRIAEVLCYEKWGTRNFNLRVRQMTDDDRKNIEAKQSQGWFAKMVEEAQAKRGGEKPGEKPSESAVPPISTSSSSSAPSTPKPIEHEPIKPVNHPIETLSSDGLWKEYETVDAEINTTRKEHPDIEEIESEESRLAAALAELDTKIQEQIKRRDSIQGSAQERAKNLLETLRTKKNELKDSLGKIRHRIQVLSKKITRLKFLKERLIQIENQLGESNASN